MKKLILITSTFLLTIFSSCSKEDSNLRNKDKFETDLENYQTTNKNYVSSLEYTQNLIGTLNNQSVDWDIWTSINTENGETFSKAYFNDSEYKSAAITIIVTYKCFSAIPGPEGVLAFESLINGDTYTRELIYSFENGEEIYVETDANISETNAISNISGEFPEEFISNFEEIGSLTLTEPANFIVENIEGQGIKYSGTAIYAIGEKEYHILIESKYLYDVQNDLNENYYFTIESDHTYVDEENNDELNKIAKFNKSNI